MSAGVPTNPARRSKSYAAADTAVANGIKTTFSTSTSVQIYTNAAADFNGAVVAAGGVLDLPRTVTITLSNTASAFTTDPIVLTGRRGGKVVTESLTPSTVNGNETLRGNQAFDVLESIAFPTQGSGAGSFTIGVQDICAPLGDTFTAVKLHADGTLCVRYGDASGPTDAIPVVVANQSTERIAPTRVQTGAGKTVVGVTVYLP